MTTSAVTVTSCCRPVVGLRQICWALTKRSHHHCLHPPVICSISPLTYSTATFYLLTQAFPLTTKRRNNSSCSCICMSQAHRSCPRGSGIRDRPLSHQRLPGSGPAASNQALPEIARRGAISPMDGTGDVTEWQLSRTHSSQTSQEARARQSKGDHFYAPSDSRSDSR